MIAPARSTAVISTSGGPSTSGMPEAYRLQFILLRHRYPLFKFWAANSPLLMDIRANEREVGHRQYEHIASNRNKAVYDCFLPLIVWLNLHLGAKTTTLTGSRLTNCKGKSQ